MKVSDIITLIGAGYSKADIEAMEAQEAITTPEPAQQPEPEKQAAPIPDPQPQQPASDPELLEAIKSLTAAVQHNNKINTPQPVTVTGPEVQTQADEILAKFCNT